MQLSEHLSLENFQYSAKASELHIDNSMPANLIPHAEQFAQHFYEKVYSILNGKFIQNSGFRSLALNNALPNASKTSQHMTANAIDMHPSNMSLGQAFKTLIESDLVYDQIFLEGVHKGMPEKGWIHGSYNTHPDFHNGVNRRQIKIVNFVNGQPQYTLVSKEQAVDWIKQRGC